MQPTWKLIANLGDVNPIEYGGYFVYRDETGTYTEEAELLLEPPEDATEERWTVYRVPLDRCKLIRGYLVSAKYKADWPHPLPSYDEWFHKDLEGVADSMDWDIDELREAFCSADPLKRAEAYRAVGDYHGWENLDSYPLTLTREEVETRYTENP
jgi:hypothetical protein